MDTRLLAWAAIFGLYLIPERLLKATCKAALKRHESGAASGLFWRALGAFVAGPWYRHVCAAVAAVNIYVLLVGNLVGYALGWDGLVRMVSEALRGGGGGGGGSPFGVFLPLSLLYLYSAAQLMFWKRHAEAAGR